MYAGFIVLANLGYVLVHIERAPRQAVSEADHVQDLNFRPSIGCHHVIVT